MTAREGILQAWYRDPTDDVVRDAWDWWRDSFVPVVGPANGFLEMLMEHSNESILRPPPSDAVIPYEVPLDDYYFYENLIEDLGETSEIIYEGECNPDATESDCPDKEDEVVFFEILHEVIGDPVPVE